MISFIKRRKILLSVILALIIIIFFAMSARGNNGTEMVTVTKGDLVRTVELAGKVVPMDEADLSFEVGGTVASVHKKVGDRVVAGQSIVELDSSSTYADFLKARADLEAAEAELAKLSGGTDLSVKISNSRTTVVQNIVDAYTKSDDAIYNKVDQFFENPKTPNPKIIASFDDSILRDRINETRVAIGTTLANWKTRIDTLSVTTYTEEDLDRAKNGLRAISLFLDDVSRAVNSFKATDSLTQTSIDKYRTDVSTARQNINTAASSLISGAETLSENVSDVPVQAARVSAAQATVANYQSRLGKMALRSPITGVVSKQDAKVGEAISANTNVVSIISSDYMIEAYVPEVSVAGVVVGAAAKVTLDAYGDDVTFDAKVMRIDPRETVRDGVSTYKIELAFNTVDERVRSGMTSNITIETLRKNNVVLVPLRAITETVDNKKIVKMVTGKDDPWSLEIEIGDTDTEGNAEVVSGPKVGDTILLDPEK